MGFKKHFIVNTFCGGIMNKSELVAEMNNQLGMSKRECKLCLDVVVDVIKSVLSRGDSVELSNFGKFKVNVNKPKSIYNFKTKNVEVVDESKTLLFKASNNLKKCIK